MATDRDYLKSLGVPLWVPRDFQLPEAEPDVVIEQAQPVVQEEVQPANSVVDDIKLTQAPIDTSVLDWDRLHEHVRECTQCGLHVGRTQAVFGVGNQSADLMVIGEAPGADEDQQGEPFVGRAGQLLNEMLKSINHPRESVYIANIVKCRPPENRNPHHEEALHCSPYLQRQISLVSPKVILAVGKVAAQNLLQTDLAIGKMRGNQYRYAAGDIPVIVTYHPAYLLRSPREKRKSWEDLKQVKQLLT